MSLKETLHHRIRRIIAGTDQGRWPGTAKFLLGLSFGFDLIARIRIWLYDKQLLKSHRLPCLVIAVGNVTTGGTGKTPMAIHVAQRMQQLGRRVVVLSRGYRGQAEKKGGWVSDGRRILMGPDSAGDEPYMMAAKLPGIPIRVGRDRYRSGLDAIHRFKADTLVLDDAFQHLRVKRDLNLLLLDAQRPFGNGHLLPRGPLRMPVASIGRADAVVCTRCGKDAVAPRLSVQLAGSPRVFLSRHAPSLYKVVPSGAIESKSPLTLAPLAPSAVKGSTVLAFAGIADNESFKQSLNDLGLAVAGFIGYDDHHRYSQDDLNRIRKARNEVRAPWLATTEKDFYRICHRLERDIAMIVVGIDIAFLPDEAAFVDFLRQFLKAKAGLAAIYPR
jgi:tetraacyldisaccharide 4'-kinase